MGSISALESLVRAAEELVERGAVGALDALLQLRVDVERHRRIGVADLTHDPLDVEAIGQQSYRYVGPPQTVWRRPSKRGKTAG